MSEELYTAYDIGQALKVKPATVWRWAREGRIPVITINPRVKRFVFADVMAALAGPAAPVAGGVPDAPPEIVAALKNSPIC